VTLVKDMAIVLRRLDYSETSQVLAVFTREHGQVRLIAKGVKRSTKTRVATGIDLLELGQAVFSLRTGKEDNLATLTEWRQEDGFAHLRRDLARSYAAQYAAEITSQLTEVHDPHVGLFDALRRFLPALAEEDTVTALVGYLWVLLREIGLRPDLGRCVSCGRPTEGGGALFFSSREGGAICRDCEPAMIEKRRIPPAIGRALTDEGLSDKSLAMPAFELLDYHFTELMSHPPRTSRLLRQAIGPRRSDRRSEPGGSG
jgi:DNA repair protein RecO (recombination protein O)